MKKRIVTLIIFTLLFITTMNIPTFAFEAEVDFLNVKIGSSMDLNKEYTLTSDSGFNLYEVDNKQWPINYIEDLVIKVRLNFAGEIEIFNVSDEYLYTIPSDGSIIIGPGTMFQTTLNVDKNNYRDYITFISKENKISLINHINIENYLYGVVPKEMPAGWPMEALKAQAIVARSFALANMNKHKQEGFNLCDSTCCQVYRAYDNENPNTNQAVNETKGIYVFYNGKVASTPYHSTSGGYTEDSAIAWGGSLPYLVPIHDVYSEGQSANNWSLKVSPLEIGNKLLLKGINIGQIQDVQILKTSSANRVLELKIVGSLGEEIISGNNLRTLLGNTTMKSTWFDIDKVGEGLEKKIYVMDGISRYPVEIKVNSAYILDGKGYSSPNRTLVSRAVSKDRTASIGESMSITPTSFVFSGKGYGHGVGMSQYGAMEMAKLGFNYEDIIKHYYNGVDIINLNGDN